MAQQDIGKKSPIPNPSGEAFVGQFVLFIDSISCENQAKGSVPVKIQPRALEYLAQRLEVIRDLQRLRSSDPMGFISGASKDLSDYKRLKKVQHFLEAVRHLKLHSAAKGVRDPTPVTLSPFLNLATLELRGCDLSSQCIRGIGQTRKTLEKMICSDSIEKLKHVLAPLQYDRRGVEWSEEDIWPKLTHLSCQCNSITEIDSSLGLAPALTSLDLSRNHLTTATHISGLVFLDLSHNLLTDLGQIPDTCPHLEKLFFQGNRLKNTLDIEKLECLQVLDVGWNLLASLVDVVRVARLPKLRELGLEGNPLSIPSSYRVNVMSCFLERDGELVLDGMRSSEIEMRKSRKARVSEAGEVMPVTLADRRTVVPPHSFLRGVWNFAAKQWLPADKVRRPSSAMSDVTSVGKTTPKKQHKPVRRVVNIPDSEEECMKTVSSQETMGGMTSRYTYPERSAKSLSHQYDGIFATSSAGKIPTWSGGTNVQADAFTLPATSSTSLLQTASGVPYSVV